MRLKNRVLKHNLDDLCAKMPIYIYKKTDSTNTRAKTAAEHGLATNAVFLADEQTAGRGRMGRRFISDGKKGLYLSILLGEESAKRTGTAITTYMAVIAARVIERLSGLSAKIKWVNDIYVGEKKLAGILTEGKTNPKSGSLEYAICGIGVNLLTQPFDNDVKRIATSVEDEAGIKLNVNVVAAEIINDFFSNIDHIGSKEIAEEYKSRSFLIGKKVDVIKASTTYTATVLDITDECELLVQREGSSTELLFTGEVSLKINS